MENNSTPARKAARARELDALRSEADRLEREWLADDADLSPLEWDAAYERFQAAMLAYVDLQKVTDNEEAATESKSAAAG